jgi:hypothetical protein
MILNLVSAILFLPFVSFFFFAKSVSLNWSCLIALFVKKIVLHAT